MHLRDLDVCPLFNSLLENVLLLAVVVTAAARDEEHAQRLGGGEGRGRIGQDSGEEHGEKSEMFHLYELLL